MKNFARPALFCAALLCAGTLPAAAADGSLTTTLRKHMSTFELGDGQLRGPAAPDLLAAARKAQFILIGEDHGFADVPEFAGALKRSLGADAPPNLVLEIGPWSAERVESALRQGRDALTELNRRYPAALPFLNLRQDGDLAALYVDSKNSGAHLWGIDQEFILSVSMHLDALTPELADAKAREQWSVYVDKAQQAYAKMVSEHDPGSMPLLQFTAADFEAMGQLFAGDADARALLADLAQSADIYRGQNTSAFDSNRARSLLMKRNFMRYYRQASGSGPARAMFKMGAFHAARGRSAVGLYDIGNMASELAESNGSGSLHILVLAGGGTVNRWLPFIADQAARTQAYAAAEELAQIGAEPMLDAAAGAGTWVIFDMTALRRVRLPEGTAPKTRDLIYNYDRIVVVPIASAADIDE
jgi:hypothetical protein